MIKDGEVPRDLSRLVVPLVGSLEATGDLFEPFGWSMPVAWWLSRLRRISGSWLRAGVRRRRAGRMGWTCCAGGGSCGWRGSAEIRRPVLPGFLLLDRAGG
jgi:hypothetical protein